MRNTKFFFATITGVLCLGFGLALCQEPDLSSGDDVNGNDWRVLDVSDFVVSMPLPGNDLKTDPLTQNNFIFPTKDNGINPPASDSNIVVSGGKVCTNPADNNNQVVEKPLRQQIRTARLMRSKFDHIVNVYAAKADDCGLRFKVHELMPSGNKFSVSSTKVFKPGFKAGLWLQSAVYDFDRDGFDEILILDENQAFVAYSKDPDADTPVLAFGPRFLNSSDRTPASEPTVGDFNGDKILDVAFAGGPEKDGKEMSVFFLSVCPGPVEGTICAGKSRFEIVAQSASIPLGVTYGNSGVEDKGNNRKLQFPLVGVAAGTYKLPSESHQLAVAVANNDKGTRSTSVNFYEFDSNFNWLSMAQTSIESGGDAISALLVAADRIDWFGNTDQLVIAQNIGNLNAKNRKRTIHVLWFDATGALALAQSQESIAGDDRLLGLTLGKFSETLSQGDTTDALSTRVLSIGILRHTPGTNAPNYRILIYGVGIQKQDGVLTDISFSGPAKFALQLGFGSDNNRKVLMAPQNGSLLQKGDLQGRGYRLGDPIVVRTQRTTPLVITAMPPMHVGALPWADITSADVPEGADCVPSPDNPDSPICTINFSVLPSTFATQYNFDGQASSAGTTRNTLGYSLGVGIDVKQKSQAGFSVAGVKSTVSQSLEVAAQLQGERTRSLERNRYEGIGLGLEAATAGADTVFYLTETDNIFNYPILGVTCADIQECTGAPDDQAYFTLAGPTNMVSQVADGRGLEWYQPPWAAGDIFTYPWACSQLQEQFSGFDLLSQMPPVFQTGLSRVEFSVNWAGGTSGSRTVEAGLDAAAEVKLSMGTSQKFEGTGESLKVTGNINASTAWSGLTMRSTAFDSSTGILVSNPGSFADASLFRYNFRPFIFSAQPFSGESDLDPFDPSSIDPMVSTGDIQPNGIPLVGFTANPAADESGSWWSTRTYAQFVDIGFALPDRWTWETQQTLPNFFPPQCLVEKTGSTNATCVSLRTAQEDVWNSPFYYMRGFFIIPAVDGVDATEDAIVQPDGIVGTVIEATQGDVLLLETRVYNKSLRNMPDGSHVKVRFYAQPWDKDTNMPLVQNGAAVPSILVGEYDAGVIPSFNPDRVTPSNCTDTFENNWKVAFVNWDTSQIVFEDDQPKYYTFWVVAWAEDAMGNLISELPLYGLTQNPSDLTLDWIQDVPIEKYSNNMGFYKQVFALKPPENQTQSVTPGPIVPSALEQSSQQQLTGATPGKVGHPKFVEIFSPELRHRVGRESAVQARIQAGDEPLDRVVVSFYDGDPLDGGRLFDQDVFPFLPANETFLSSVPFSPRDCGDNEVFVAALEGSRLDRILEKLDFPTACEIFAAHTGSKDRKLRFKKRKNRIKLKYDFEVPEQIDLRKATSLIIESGLRNLDDGGAELLAGAKQLILLPEGRAGAKKVKFTADLGDISFRAKLKKKKADTFALKLDASNIELGKVKACVGAQPVVDLETSVIVTGVAAKDLVLSASRLWKCIKDDSGRVTGLAPFSF